MHADAASTRHPPPAMPAGILRCLRVLFVLALAPLFAAAPAHARIVTDATGRTVTIPDAPARVMAAGPPAAVLLHVLKPEAMVGWVRAPRPADLPFLLPATHGLPELGRLTGRDDNRDLESVRSARPDLIVDFGTVNAAYRGVAERVQAQTGVPFILIDGSLANTPQALRQLGDILGVPDRAEALARHAEATFARVDAALAGVPLSERPGVYLARGPEGLETAGPDAINAEIIARVGARNVVEAPGDGLLTLSPEAVRALAPDAIVTIDPRFAARVSTDPAWTGIPAVTSGRVHLAPSAPFGFIDGPPSVNRLIGLHWLMDKLYPEAAKGDLAAEVKAFYALFYQVIPDDAAVSALLGE